MAATVRNMVGFWIPQEAAIGFAGGSFDSNGSGEGKAGFDGDGLEAFQASTYPTMGSDTIGWLHGEIKVEDFGDADDESVIIYCENQVSSNRGPQLFVKLSGSGFVVGLYQSNGSTLIGYGSTVFSFGTWYEFRTEGGTFGAVLDFGVLGSMTEQVNDKTYTQLLDTRIHPVTTNHSEAAKFCHYRNVALLTSTTRVDRMAEPDIQEKIHNDSGTPDFDEFNTSSGSDKSILVDDWESGNADDNTTHLITDVAANDTDRQTLLTDSLTLANIIAVKVYGRIRLDIDDKDGTAGVMISDGSGNFQELQLLLISNGWFYRRSLWNTNGNGDPWTQTRLDDMEYGFSYTDGGDITNLRATVVHCEALAMVADAGVDPGDRRFTQVI